MRAISAPPLAVSRMSSNRRSSGFSRFSINPAASKRAAARLEAAGLIEKRENPEDRRLLDMRLTAKGGALIARIVPIADAYQAELLALLGPDAAGFGTGLQKLYEDR